MFDNPLIERYRHSSLRPRHVWIYVSIYVLTVFLIVSVNTMHAARARQFDLTGLAEALFGQLMLIEIGILWAWMAINSGTAIRNEIREGSHDFLRLVPVTSAKKVIGITIGRNLLALILGTLNGVFLLILGLTGGIDIWVQAEMLLSLVSGAVLISLLALMASTQATKKNPSGGTVLMVIVAVLCVPNAIFLFGRVDLMGSIGGEYVPFFAWDVPTLVLLSMYALYFSAWVFKGTTRKLSRPHEPLFTRTGAILFMIGIEILAFSLFWREIGTSGRESAAGLWVVTFVPLAFIPLGTCKSHDLYMEQYQGAGAGQLFRFLKDSDLLTRVYLFLVWAAAVPLLPLKGSPPPYELSEIITVIAVLGAFYAVLCLMLEAYVVTKPRFEMIHILLVFLVVVYLILPTILSVALDADGLMQYSPAGVLMAVVLMAEEEAVLDQGTIAINGLLCVLLLRHVLRGYRAILVARLPGTDS